MAIFDWSLQTVQRSAGESAVAAAAYRSGTCLRDHRTGIEHDFTRRRDIHAEIIMPAGVTAPALDNPSSRSELRAKLWNAAEAAEGRKNSVVAREVLLALPHELPRDRQLALARGYAGYIVRRFGVVADIAIHPPSRGGDQRNWHCHILFTTRRVEAGFAFGSKTRELDAAATGGPIIKELRERWADFANLMLLDVGSSATVDHRSLVDRGITRAPHRHIGPQATNLARKFRGKADRLIAEAAELEREALTVLWPRPELAETFPEPAGWERGWLSYADDVKRAAREAAEQAKLAEVVKSKPLPVRAAPEHGHIHRQAFDITILEEGDMAPALRRPVPKSPKAIPLREAVVSPLAEPSLTPPAAPIIEVGDRVPSAAPPTPKPEPLPARFHINIVDEGDMPDDMLTAAIRAGAKAKAKTEGREARQKRDVHPTSPAPPCELDKTDERERPVGAGKGKGPVPARPVRGTKGGREGR